MKEDLSSRAQWAYPDAPDSQAKWEAAVQYLRAGRGWVADGIKGWNAAGEPTPAKPVRAPSLKAVEETVVQIRKGVRRK